MGFYDRQLLLFFCMVIALFFVICWLQRKAVKKVEYERRHCPRCKSTNIRYEAVPDMSIRSSGPGLIYWILVLATFGGALLLYPFASKSTSGGSNAVSIGICNKCGASWKLKDKPKSFLDI